MMSNLYRYPPSCKLKITKDLLIQRLEIRVANIVTVMLISSCAPILVVALMLAGQMQVNGCNIHYNPIPQPYIR